MKFSTLKESPAVFALSKNGFRKKYGREIKHLPTTVAYIVNKYNVFFESIMGFWYTKVTLEWHVSFIVEEISKNPG